MSSAPQGQLPGRLPCRGPELAGEQRKPPVSWLEEGKPWDGQVSSVRPNIAWAAACPEPGAPRSVRGCACKGVCRIHRHSAAPTYGRCLCRASRENTTGCCKTPPAQGRPHGVDQRAGPPSPAACVHTCGPLCVCTGVSTHSHMVQSGSLCTHVSDTRLRCTHTQVALRSDSSSPHKGGPVLSALIISAPDP